MCCRTPTNPNPTQPNPTQPGFACQVRKACVDHMSKHVARFGVFVAEDFRDYLYRISQPGVWGDDLEIRWDPTWGCLREDRNQQRFLSVSHHCGIWYQLPVGFRGGCLFVFVEFLLNFFEGRFFGIDKEAVFCRLKKILFIAGSL